jgi:hypothetical protein
MGRSLGRLRCGWTITVRRVSPCAITPESVAAGDAAIATSEGWPPVGDAGRPQGRFPGLRSGRGGTPEGVALQCLLFVLNVYAFS